MRLIYLLGAFLLAGCSSPDRARSWNRTGDPIVDGKYAIEQGPEKDRVLWQYRTALEALRRELHDDAKTLLDAALARISGIYGTDRDARKSRGYFRSESRKTFVGEPYERVMAYYYRGILYWMDGEIDNARACFRSGQFMDSDAENQEYASDYALLEYLDGLATAKLGGDGSDAFRRARELARDAKLPDPDPAANVLLFLEFGQGPSKYATGEYGEQLRFHPGRSSVKRVRIRGPGVSLTAEPYDDLTFQATTRGGRVMDHVLANKAVFKSATDSAGDVAIIGGAILASQGGRNSSADEVGAGLMLAGVVSKIFSAATTPAADTRAWDNLPQRLSFAALRLAPGTHILEFDFLDAAGQVLAGRTRTFEVSVSDTGRDTVVFVSDPAP